MIISNDFELRRFIPNVMSTVEGEGSLYEKIEPYMGLVEVSLSDIFIGPEMLANPRSMPEALRNAASVYVANEAFRMAVPSLDLVLTPNGFGIVNNQNVVPASKERIERLMFSLAQMRDKAVSTMVIALADIDGYAETPQGEWFSSSLFLPLAGVTFPDWSTPKNPCGTSTSGFVISLSLSKTRRPMNLFRPN